MREITLVAPRTGETVIEALDREWRKVKEDKMEVECFGINIDDANAIETEVRDFPFARNIDDPLGSHQILRYKGIEVRRCR